MLKLNRGIGQTNRQGRGSKVEAGKMLALYIEPSAGQRPSGRESEREQKRGRGRGRQQREKKWEIDWKLKTTLYPHPLMMKVRVCVQSPNPIIAVWTRFSVWLALSGFATNANRWSLKFRTFHLVPFLLFNDIHYKKKTCGILPLVKTKAPSLPVDSCESSVGVATHPCLDSTKVPLNRGQVKFS